MDKKQHDVGTIVLIVVSSVLGCAVIFGIGYLTVTRINRNIQSYADVVYHDSIFLTEKYAFDLQNMSNKVETKAEVAVKSDTSVSSEITTKQESLDSPEAATEYPKPDIVEHDDQNVYIIKPGDTLTKISAALGYSVDELANYNEIRDVNLIYANSVLQIPKK